ncbi:helix-turn-helix domain-containing protein [Gordonia McavH-238-E]|uniref:helix-turn-helix transcriptional regulator n=1 Tax=Gordonia sp. McavH-238-E TaxID=2917736 RepID=UPI001EF47CFA|nr:helix-turn-helix domain-containing protein [Gordonia sp. McavH-238-E]MCG7631130.1 helix-turn-helix domain-containing protein [Gordonia sp. McavH-238-E]
MNTNTIPERFTPRTLADYLGVAPQTVYGWSHRGQGPIGYRVGGRKYYDRADVDAWIAAQKAQDIARRTA